MPEVGGRIRDLDAPEWSQDYNHSRPHSALAGLTPEEYRLGTTRPGVGVTEPPASLTIAGLEIGGRSFESATRMGTSVATTKKTDGHVPDAT